MAGKKGRSQQAGFSAHAKCCGTAFGEEGSERSSECFHRMTVLSRRAVASTCRFESSELRVRFRQDLAFDLSVAAVNFRQWRAVQPPGTLFSLRFEV